MALLPLHPVLPATGKYQEKRFSVTSDRWNYRYVLIVIKRREYFPNTGDEEYDTLKGNLESGIQNNNFALKSYGVLKPDITFFGEALPSKFHKTIREDIMKCDLLICIGTSLKVAPVSEIVNMIPAYVPQVLINKDPVKHAEFDIELLGFCDDVATVVAQKCEWDIPHKDWEGKLKRRDLMLTRLSAEFLI